MKRILIISIAFSIFTLYKVAFSQNYPFHSWTKIEDGASYGYTSMNVVTSQTDDQNNLYISGYTLNDTSRSDIFLVKYNPSGEQKWIKFYDVYNTDCRPYSMAIDDYSNVYLTGFSYNLTTNITSNLTIKYDSSGLVKWASYYENPLGYLNSDICICDTNNIYVTGITMNNDSTFIPESMILKYNSNGDLIWHVTSIIGNHIPIINAMDSSQFIFTRVGPGGCNLIRYNSQGEIIWKCVKDTLIDDITIKMDNSNNLYICGRWVSPQIALVKYSSVGSLLWTVVIDSINNIETINFDVDSIGNSYITATHYSWKGTTLKYDTNGNLLWKRYFIDDGAFEYRPESICYNKSGNIIIVGISSFSGGQKRIILSYDSDGVQSGIVRIDNLLVDPILITSNESYFYLVSKECISRYIYHVNIMRFDFQDNKVHIPVETPDQFILYPNYPNPFNPQTIISYDLPKPGKVKLEVYNLRGQKIRTIVDQIQSKGKYTHIWNGENNDGQKVGSGIYLYKLKIGNQVASKKMTLIR